MSPEFLNKLEASSEVVIDKIANLSQMQDLVSTENKFERLNINIQSDIGSPLKQTQKDILEDLINIKYMNLQDLKLTIEMGKVNDKHLLLISESL